MTYGEFLRALIVVVVVAIAYGLATPFLYQAWSATWDMVGKYVERRTTQ